MVTFSYSKKRFMVTTGKIIFWFMNTNEEIFMFTFYLVFQVANLSWLLPRYLLQSGSDLYRQKQSQRSRLHFDFVPANGIRSDGQSGGQAFGDGSHLPTVLQNAKLPRGTRSRFEVYLWWHAQRFAGLLSTQDTQENVLSKVGHTHSRARK